MGAKPGFSGRIPAWVIQLPIPPHHPIRFFGQVNTVIDIITIAPVVITLASDGQAATPVEFYFFRILRMLRAMVSLGATSAPAAMLRAATSTGRRPLTNRCATLPANPADVSDAQAPFEPREPKTGHAGPYADQHRVHVGVPSPNSGAR